MIIWTTCNCIWEFCLLRVGDFTFLAKENNRWRLTTTTFSILYRHIFFMKVCMNWKVIMCWGASTKLQFTNLTCLVRTTPKQAACDNLRMNKHYYTQFEVIIHCYRQHFYSHRASIWVTGLALKRFNCVSTDEGRIAKNTSRMRSSLGQNWILHLHIHI